MEVFVFIALGFLIYVMICYWVAGQVRYRVSRSGFRILLFEICLRHVDFKDMESVSKRRPGGWVENWSNTFHPNHRMLVIRLKKGFRRSIVITPKNRYILRSALEKEIERSASPTRQEDAEPAAVITD